MSGVSPSTNPRGVTKTDRSSRPGWSTQWTSPPESSASLAVLSRALPSGSLSLSSDHCSLEGKSDCAFEAASSSFRSRASKSSRRSRVRTWPSSRATSLLFLFRLEVCDLFLVLPGRLGGFLSFHEIGLFLPKDRDFALQLNVLVRKGCDRLLQRFGLRLQLEHLLGPGGIFASTGTCNQSGGQHDADRHRTKISQRASPNRRWGGCLCVVSSVLRAYGSIHPRVNAGSFSQLPMAV